MFILHIVEATINLSSGNNVSNPEGLMHQGFRDSIHFVAKYLVPLSKNALKIH